MNTWWSGYDHVIAHGYDSSAFEHQFQEENVTETWKQEIAQFLGEIQSSAEKTQLCLSNKYKLLRIYYDRLN